MATKSFVYRTKAGYDFISAGSIPGSKQIGPDYFEEVYDKWGLVRPPHDFDLLANLYEMDTWHRRAILTKAHDATGLGWDIVEDPKYKGGDEKAEPKDEDRKQLMKFFSDCSPEMSLESILEAVWVDYDVLGNGAIEVVRDGKAAPVELYHIPFKTVRVHRSGELFAQIRGVAGESFRRSVWFKEFGEDDAIIREAATLGRIKLGEPGELIHVRAYDARSSYYGVPESISAVGSIAANSAVRDYNLGKLVNRGIPDYIMTLEGMELDSETQQMVEDFLNDAKDKSLRDGPKLLTFEVGQGKATFEKVTPETEDANWLEYRKANRDEILAAHAVPKYRLGVAETGTMGQNVATEQSKIYAMGVVRHRRHRMEHLLTQWIIKKGFGIEGWRIEFNEIDLRNEKEEAEMDFKRTGGVPVETVNEVRRKRHLGPDLEGGDRVMMRVGHEVIDIARIPGSKVPADLIMPTTVEPSDSPRLPPDKFRPGEEPETIPQSDRVDTPPVDNPAAPSVPAKRTPAKTGA